MVRYLFVFSFIFSGNMLQQHVEASSKVEEQQHAVGTKNLASDKDIMWQLNQAIQDDFEKKHLDEATKNKFSSLVQRHGSDKLLIKRLHDTIDNSVLYGRKYILNLVGALVTGLVSAGLCAVAISLGGYLRGNINIKTYQISYKVLMPSILGVMVGLAGYFVIDVGLFMLLRIYEHEEKRDLRLLYLYLCKKNIAFKRNSFVLFL